MAESNDSIEINNTATESILLDGINANSTPKIIENKISLEDLFTLINNKFFLKAEYCLKLGDEFINDKKLIKYILIINILNACVHLLSSPYNHFISVIVTMLIF